jgi:hypothetical protein
MRDHLTINAQAQDDIVLEKALRVRIARYVSNILAPVTISLPFVVLVALYHAHNTLTALLYAALTLFFLSLGPMVYILIGVRLGRISDVDVSRRRERAGPFLFGLASVGLGLLALRYIHGPRVLETMLLMTAISGVIMMVITLWWKISIHASSMAATLTMLTVLYGAIVLPLFTLLVMVSWSRVILRRHTIAQVISGSLLSIILSAVLLKLRGV